MFRKNFKTKTSTTVKGSEKRRLKTFVENQYTNLSANEIESLLPSKSDMNQVKALTYNGVVSHIYFSNNNPIFFQIEDNYYPSIYTIWNYPNLLPSITTVPPVLEKIINGADLMAPGIVINDSTLIELNKLKLHDICSIKISGNKYPIAVGKLVMAPEELCTDNVKGKAVAILHNYKDYLWMAGNQMEIPFSCDDNDSSNNDEENIELNKNDETQLLTSDNSKFEVEEIEKLTLDDNPNESEEVITNINTTPTNYSMDQILLNSFMSAIKMYYKKIQLPILTSTFYSSYVLKCCPPELNLDIKKTSFKKLSPFLKKMQKDGIIQVKELSKGVESIVSINSENENFQRFNIEPLFKNYIQEQKSEQSEQIVGENIQGNYKFPTVTELFVVSAQVKTLFEFAHIRKGETITGIRIKEVLKNYVKENSLQNETNPRDVILDPLLSDCALKKGENRTCMQWDELYQAIISKMPNAYQVSFNEKEITKKGKLEPIDVVVDTRTGNKKVTLIYNLETYGINPEKLAQHVQVAVAASTSITTTQNGKGIVVLIQGNQVRYLQKLFLEIYKVPRKYIKGLENVPKKK